MKYHVRNVAFIVLFSFAIAGICLGLVAWQANVSLTHEEQWSTFCWSILLSWWIVYFNHRRLGVTNLRAFLDNKNPFRRGAERQDKQADPAAQAENQRRIVAKASASIGAQGIQIAIVALLLNQVLGLQLLTPYRQLVRPWIVALAMVTILLLCFAIDIFDTSANIFDPGSQSEKEYRQWFFRHVGPFAPKGGVTYAYYGFAALSIFFVVALSYLYVPLSGVGVAVYIYLGYPYLYGYYRVGETVATVATVEIDEDAAWPAFLFSACVVSVTAVVHLV